MCVCVCEGYVNCVWYRHVLNYHNNAIYMQIHIDKGKHKQTKLPDLSSSPKEYWLFAPSLCGFTYLETNKYLLIVFYYLQSWEFFPIFLRDSQHLVADALTKSHLLLSFWIFSDYT